jgi:hypothetical protein
MFAQDFHFALPATNILPLASVEGGLFVLSISSYEGPALPLPGTGNAENLIFKRSLKTLLRPLILQFISHN